MKKVAGFAMVALIATGCVSKQKYVELEEAKKATDDKLSSAKMELATLKAEKEAKESELASLRANYSDAMKQLGDLARMSAKNAENMERTLEEINEQELTISRMQDAMNRKDSVTLALVTSLKGALGNMNDEDVNISVEKGVVYINLSDNLMFKPGSSVVSKEAKEVLAKVAKILEAKPTLEILVEGHTDTDPIETGCVRDNWDLSVKRAVNIVRVLQEDYNIDPARMSAAGRGEYVPVADNATREGRAENRRTRIVVLPKLDEFNKLIEEGLK